MASDHDLIAQYPNKPPKLLLRWQDARVAVQRAGEAYVARPCPATDAALLAAELEEQAQHRALFGI